MSDRSRGLWKLRLLLAGIGCVLACCFGLQGCHSAPAEDVEKPVVTVQAIHPRLGEMTEQIVGDAVLAPVEQAAIQSKVNAPIKAIYVQIGSRVKAGALLAKLESQDLAAAALDNEGGYKAAQGAYSTETQQQVPLEETQARLDFEQAKLTLALDQDILKARAQLFSEGAIPGRDVDTARATVLLAQAAYQLAQQKFNLIDKVGRRASLEAAEGQLASAKGKYLGSRAQLGYTELRSPISGVVTERPLFAGETATPGTPVVTVMNTTTLIAKLHLAQRQAQQLATGAAATILVPGVDEPIAAKVSLVSPALDAGSTTVEVWLRVDNAKGTLKVGTTVHAIIQGKTTLHALTIPLDAVQRASDSGNTMVMLVGGDSTAHKKSVAIGTQTAERAQVITGLNASDMVITKGGYGLDDGTRVMVQAANEKPDADAKPGADAKPDAGTN